MADSLEMYQQKLLSSILLLFIAVTSVSSVNAEQQQIDLYRDAKFALGPGAAVVRFDTNVKFTDKQTGDTLYIDAESNLDLPETGYMSIIYGA